jgi:signal peptidase
LSWLAHFSATLLATALLFLAVAVTLVPRLYHGLAMTVLSGSMEPSFSAGDIIVTRGFEPTNLTDLAIGDIITFLPYPDDPTLVTHRITGKTVGPNGEIGFITQGDNNDVADPWGPVEPRQIRGTILYAIPKLGYLQRWVGGAASTIVLVTAIGLLVYGGVNLILAWRHRRSAGNNPVLSPVTATDSAMGPTEPNPVPD